MNTYLCPSAIDPTLACSTAPLALGGIFLLALLLFFAVFLLLHGRGCGYNIYGTKPPHRPSGPDKGSVSSPRCLSPSTERPVLVVECSLSSATPVPGDSVTEKKPSTELVTGIILQLAAVVIWSYCVFYSNKYTKKVV